MNISDVSMPTKCVSLYADYITLGTKTLFSIWLSMYFQEPLNYRYYVELLFCVRMCLVYIVTSSTTFDVVNVSMM